MVNIDPHALVPSMNNVGEVQPYIIEAHKGPRPIQSIHIGSDKGMKVVDSHVRVNSKNLPVKRKDKGKNVAVVFGSSAGEQVVLEKNETKLLLVKKWDQNKDGKRR